MSRIWIAVCLLLCVVVGLADVFLAPNRPEPAPVRNDKPDAPVPQGDSQPPIDMVAIAPMPRLLPVFDTYVSKTTGMKFVRVKAGTFTMGSVEPERSHRDETAHEVTLTKDFYLGIYEVTRGQFRKFVESTGYETEAEANGGSLGWVARRKKEEWREEFTWQNPGFEQTDDHPVVNVSWNDAVKFAEWLSRKDGRTYRLPTEVEWEYANRGGSTSRFSFGDDNEDISKYGNSADASYHRETDRYVSVKSDDGYAFTAPVGQYRPNSFGLYDMHGNVSEKCSGWYGAYPGGSVDDYYWRDPKPAHVFRGGTFANKPDNCRSACRGWGVPESRNCASGFRLAMELTPPPNQPVDIIDMPPKPKPVTDIYVSKTTGMKFVRVKGGTFKMGLPKKDDEYESAREHEVTLTKDFYMGVYEVTRGEFSKFVESTAHITEAERYGGLGWDAANKKFEFGKQFTWQNPGFEQTDDHPVVLVSWDDAVKFAEWLSRKDGRTYRLPTEAEWEYACRGRSTTRFHFGDAWEDLVMYANSADASYDRTTGENRGSKEDDGFAFTAPVGKFRPNKFGLYDMHGNVREWCSDWYRPYPRGRVIDPRGPETDKDRHRVIRGGSWAWEGGGCQSGYRDSGVTSFSQNSKGFRLVMEPPGR